MNLAAAVDQAIDRAIAGMHKTGVVTGTSGTKVVVSVEGASLTLPRLASYSPTTNDVVQILAIRKGSWIVIGKTA